MPHTYAQNVIYVVFSTKDRRKEIPEEIQAQFWAHAAGVCKNIGVVAQAIAGTEDHIHLLIQIPPSLPLAKAVATIKANSSHEKGHRFEWQEGHGAFSVSHSLAPAAIRYIRNQKTHHKKMDFAAEFMRPLKKHGVEFDSRYVLG